jgi:hypothetical protein
VQPLPHQARQGESNDGAIERVVALRAETVAWSVSQIK